MDRSFLVSFVVLLTSSICWSDDWQIHDDEIAVAVGIVSSDGNPASLEVRCRTQPEVTLTHPVLASMPVDGNGRLDWYQGALINTGWGLDLTRPEHVGHLGLWEQCAQRPNCVRQRHMDAVWFIKKLSENWSLFIRIKPPDGAVVDLRVSLTGSAKAIDAVCSSAGAVSE